MQENLEVRQGERFRDAFPFIQPAKIAGHRAFRTEVDFKDKDGHQYRRILYGFMQNEWFYLVRYVAPERHYFARDKAAFETIVSSMWLMV